MTVNSGSLAISGGNTTLPAAYLNLNVGQFGQRPVGETAGWSR